MEPPDWISTIDWQWDNHALKLKPKESAPDISQPFWEDYATQESFDKAHKAYSALRGTGLNDQYAQQYKLLFDKDGSFRVDDVPAGTYKLAIRVTEPSKDPNARYLWRGDQVKEIGSLNKEIVIPDMPGGRSDDPLDLGNVGNEAFGGPRKLVLMTFWAAWSDACQRDLPALKAVYEAFTNDPRFAMISLSLDENADIPRILRPPTISMDPRVPR